MVEHRPRMYLSSCCGEMIVMSSRFRASAVVATAGTLVVDSVLVAADSTLVLIVLMLGVAVEGTLVVSAVGRQVESATGMLVVPAAGTMAPEDILLEPRRSLELFVVARLGDTIVAAEYKPAGVAQR